MLKVGSCLKTPAEAFSQSIWPNLFCALYKLMIKSNGNDWVCFWQPYNRKKFTFHCWSTFGNKTCEQEVKEATRGPDVMLPLTTVFLWSDIEHVWAETSDPRVQSSSHPEVPLHPAPLWHLQGRLGLADSAGDLLRGRHRSLQRLLQWRAGRRRRLEKSTQCQRHPGGDPFHFRWESTQ